MGLQGGHGAGVIPNEFFEPAPSGFVLAGIDKGLDAFQVRFGPGFPAFLRPSIASGLTIDRLLS